jgi:N-formylglutamate amidohydrolase
VTSGYAFHEGSTPLLVSVPHDGRDVPDRISRHMTPAGLDLSDTDWHVAELYSFVRGFGASMIVATSSRYVIDLNRSDNDETLYEGQLATGLCPEKTFAGHRIYNANYSVDKSEQALRLAEYWQPYHSKLAEMLVSLRAKHGFALLWDAHSIASQVPRLFDGELSQLNIGTYDDRSCASDISAAVIDVASQSLFNTAVNARFKGGFITRHYGHPDEQVHALQLEIAQRAYMNEETRKYMPEKAKILRMTLDKMLTGFLDAAERHYQ